MTWDRMAWDRITSSRTHLAPSPIQLSLTALGTGLRPREKFVLVYGAVPVPLITQPKVLDKAFRLLVQDDLLYFDSLGSMRHFAPNGRALNHPMEHGRAIDPLS